MRNHTLRYTIHATFLCSLLCIATCAVPNPGSQQLAEGLSSITVLVRNNMAYPVAQFRCSDAEDAGSNESCPEGFGCDAQHYHGTARAIGTLGANGAADATLTDFSTTSFTDDPDQCHCGWGKVTQLDIRTISMFTADVTSFIGASFTAPVEGLTEAERVSVDPCGG